MSERFEMWLIRGGLRDAGRILAMAVLFGALGVVAVYCGGCSAGPQLVPQTTPISISCTWNCGDGGACEDCDCLVDRSSAGADAVTTGNTVRDNQISPQVRTSVSGAGLP